MKSTDELALAGRRMVTIVVMMTMMVVGIAAAATGDGVPQFKTLDVKLPNNEVKAICRSSDGFLWVGTGAGLVRYDGFEAVSYSFPVSGALFFQKKSPNEFVDRIVEYPKGKLWVRSGTLYSVFDMEKEQYVEPLDHYLAGMGITEVPICVFPDSRNRLWLGFFSGNVKCRDSSGKVVDIKPLSDGIQREIVAISESAEGIIIVYNDDTVVCLHADTFKNRWSLKCNDEHVHENISLFVDREGLLWFYSHDWMKCYDPNERRWLRDEHYDSGHHLGGVIAICQDKRGRIWLGREHCLEIMDKKDGQTLTLVHDDGDERSIPHNTVTSLCCDEDGIMWVGTLKNGLAYYHENIYKNDFLHFDDVNVVCTTSDGAVWLGTNAEGLVRWTAEGMRRFSTADGLRSNTIVSLLAGHDGRLWIGTFLGGLSCYDGRSFRHYDLANSSVWALAEDDGGNIWAGTLGGGVQMLNPQTSVITTYNQQNTSLPIDFISSLCHGRNGNLYIATMSNGIYVKRPSDGVKALGKTAQMTHFVYQILEDTKGFLWMATQSGLFVYDQQKDSIINKPLHGPTPTPIVLGLAEDAFGRIWATTASEVLSIDQDGNIQVYNENDGLKVGTINQKSIHTTADGRVMVGTLQGVNILQAVGAKHSSLQSAHAPSVLFSRLDVLGRRVLVGDTIEGRQVLRASLNSQRELTLSHDMSAFTIYFSSDNMMQPAKTRFRYRLEGIDRDYYECASDVHWVSYTSLPSGHYTLHVVAVDSDGAEGEEALLSIRILPPWWRSLWAWMIYVLLGLAALFAAFFLVRRREQHKFEIQQMEDDARKAEELNQMKFRFFTNISHELRTPLTLILSPLENLYHELTDNRQKNQVGMIQKNANHLLMLVNQILDFRKMEMSDMKLQLSEGDIIEFIKNICDSFSNLNGKTGVQLTFFSAIPTLEMAFDEDKISKIMFNLLSNAFKFTPADGRVDVAIRRDKNNPELLAIRVADTGIGISDSDKERIFDRFYQVSDSAATRHASGTGIGLNLVKEFVEMHDGTISVVDNMESGSVFIILLPIRHLERPSETVQTGISEKETVNKPVLPEPTNESQDSKRKTVLVVDDNDDLVGFMRDTLSLYYHVITASNGQQAWEIIQSSRPDIIVSDMMMPVMDGNELCRLVKSGVATRNIPFVILTARHADESRLESLKIGADEYVTKPFNTEVLLLRLQKLLELSQRRGLIEPEVADIEITPLDEKLVEDAIKFVEQNMDNENLSVEDLCHSLSMSRSNLYNKMFAITGKKPREFIRVIRMKRAAQLLRDSDLSISEIAYRVGLNPRLFTKHFKDEFGCLPSEYPPQKGLS